MKWSLSARLWFLAARAYVAASRVPGVRRLLPLLGRARRALSPTREFDHASAQRYELRHNAMWLMQHHHAVWDLIHQAQAGNREPRGELNQVVLREFFANDSSLWRQFVEDTAGRTVLDIGGGPLPVMVFWPWVGTRILLDPLGDSYSQLAAHVTGRSWFHDITIMPDAAERFIPTLAGHVDGAIICRNTLDHTREPYVILSNMSRYAAAGCRLLFWTDLHHLGSRDAGHADITTDRDGFRRLIENLGFEIERETPEQEGRGTIQFGCLATKVRTGEPHPDRARSVSVANRSTLPSER